MAKKIELRFVESGVRAVATLCEDQAPKTSSAFWAALETPILQKGIHAMWTGHEVMIEIPPENHRFDPTSIPMENATAYPQAGELLWAYFSDHVERGFPRDIWDFIIIYGPDSPISCALGSMPANVWAQITENLDGFAAECMTLIDDGMKLIRVSRIEA